MRKISQNEIDKCKEDVDCFIVDFKDNMIDSIERQGVVIAYTDVLFGILPNYFNNNYTQLVPSMNALMDVMSTSNFVKAFKAVLEDEKFPDFELWFNNIVETLSILIECNHNVMSEQTITTYTWDILKRLWKPELAIIKRDIDITEELALELLIGIPKQPEKIEAMDLDRFTRTFKTSIMDHSALSDNLDLLGKYTLGRLFSFFFDKDSKTELNALGRILASKADTEEEISRWGGPIYHEYIKMIYSKLNDRDISDIKYVLNFIMTRNKSMKDRDKNYSSMFDLDIACTFTNIAIAIKSIVEREPERKIYL